MSDSLGPHGLYSPWNSPGQNTGVGSHSLLQGIFPTQGSSQPRDQTQVSGTAGSFFTTEPPGKPSPFLNSRETSISLLHWTSGLSCPLDPPCPSCCIHSLIHPIAQCMLSMGGLIDELDVLISRGVCVCVCVCVSSSSFLNLFLSS